MISSEGGHWVSSEGGKGTGTLIDAHLLLIFTLQISSVTTAAPISQQALISQLPTFPPSHSTLVDNLALNSADESLADLQPEDSEGEEEGEERAPLTPEQKVSLNSTSCPHSHTSLTYQVRCCKWTEFETLYSP